MCVFAVVGAYVINYNSPSKQIERLLLRSDRFLLEMNYEEAILTLTAVLEIDPQNEESKQKIIDAYLKWAASYADKGDYDSALNILDEGLIKTNSNMIKDQIEKYQELGVFLILKNAVEEEDFDAIYNLYKDGIIDARFDELPDIYIIGDKGENNSLSGEGIGVYRYFDTKLNDECYLIYIGDFVDGKRFGHGKWVWSIYTETTIVDVDWINDYPEGFMISKRKRDVSEITIEPGHTYPTFVTEKCKVERGIYEGNCNITWEMLNGDCEMHDWDVVYNHGIGQIVKDNVVAYCKACDASLIIGTDIKKIYGID